MSEDCENCAEHYLGGDCVDCRICATCGRRSTLCAEIDERWMCEYCQDEMAEKLQTYCYLN